MEEYREIKKIVIPTDQMEAQRRMVKNDLVSLIG